MSGGGGLVVEGLSISGAFGAPLLSDVSFSIDPGSRLGLIGESGSGKSLTALAVIGLLPDGLRASGRVQLAGNEIIGAPERELNGIRGRDVAVVFQEPLTALDPLMTIGGQLAEPLRRRAAADGEPLSRREAALVARDRLAEVRLPDPDRIVDAYPWEISGGQRQRAALAIALAGRPGLLIADEPTTALDVTVQSDILDLLDRLVDERGMSLLFISHDLAVVARVAPRVVVLERGIAVESGEMRDLLAHPQHPYTREFVASARELDAGLEWGGPR